MDILITDNYLYIPINTDGKSEELYFYENNVQVLQLSIPFAESEEEAIYKYQYLAAVPVSDWKGKTVTLAGSFGKTFMNGISQGSELPAAAQNLPYVHFAAGSGWLNDPNGLIYDNGIYHMFYQYNAFGREWGNMSWGHAASKDLLHWERLPIAMLPDENGTIFSGSAVKNERGLLGLQKDTLLFFYTSAGGSSDSPWSAGKSFVQKLAYSMNHGKTLQKMSKVIVPTLAEGNRDPKVYWHEESKGYFMSLFLENDEFAVLRSDNLENWNVTQKIVLKNASECPDLREIPTQDGGKKWVFFTAGGRYFIGNFDGYQFTDIDKGKMAYAEELAYAGQTYCGIEDRVVLVHWLRTRNEGKLYRGIMGVPRELELASVDGEMRLAFHLIREWKEQRILQKEFYEESSIRYRKEEPSAAEIETLLLDSTEISWNIFGCRAFYSKETGVFTINSKETKLIPGLDRMDMIIDRGIIELTAGNDTTAAFWETDIEECIGEIGIEADKKAAVKIYSLK